MGEILPFHAKGKRKINPKDYPLHYSPMGSALPSKLPPFPKVDPNYYYHLPSEVIMPSTVDTIKARRWSEWIGEYLEIREARQDGDTLTLTGFMLTQDNQQPDSDKAAVVYFTTRFLALMDRLRAEKTSLTRLPAIVIGQEGNGYQAMVTLTLGGFE